MLRLPIAVTQMKSQFDILGNCSRERLHALDNRSVQIREWISDVCRSPIPQYHLDTNVPLDAKVSMRNRTADCLHFLQHSAFICRLDKWLVFRQTHREDHSKRCRQRDLKLRVPG